jgi:isoleucyl-tRNA synthetase
MTPFITEEIYQNLIRNCDPKAADSIHHMEFPQSNTALIDTGLTREINALMKIISLGYSTRERAGIKIRQPLSRVLISGTDELENRAVERFRNIFLTYLNVKGLEILDPGTQKPEMPTTFIAKPNLKSIAKKIGKKTQASRVMQSNTLMNEQYLFRKAIFFKSNWTMTQ